MPSSSEKAPSVASNISAFSLGSSFMRRLFSRRGACDEVQSHSAPDDMPIEESHHPQSPTQNQSLTQQGNDQVPLAPLSQQQQQQAHLFHLISERVAQQLLSPHASPTYSQNLHLQPLLPQPLLPHPPLSQPPLSQSPQLEPLPALDPQQLQSSQSSQLQHTPQIPEQMPQAPQTTQMPHTDTFLVGESVIYVDSQGVHIPATVNTVHYDDPEGGTEH